MKKLLAIIMLSVLAVIYTLPVFVFAQNLAPKTYCWTEKECGKAGGIYTDKITPGDCVQSVIKYGYCFPKETSVKLQVPIGTLGETTSLTQYIPAVYNYLVAIVSIVAIIMIMVGGLRYLTAGGNPSAITSAKETILGAVIGLFLTFGSYVILQTINPALVTLSLPPVKMVAPQSLAQWCPNDGDFVGKFQCGIKYTPQSNPTPPINSGYCLGVACEPTKESTTQGCYSGTISPLTDTPHCVPDLIGKLIKTLENKAAACNGSVLKQLSGTCSSMIIFTKGQISDRGLNDSPTFKEYLTYAVKNLTGVLVINPNEFMDIASDGSLRVELCAEVTLASKSFGCNKNDIAINYVAQSISKAWNAQDKKFLDAIAGPLGTP